MKKPQTQANTKTQTAKPSGEHDIIKPNADPEIMKRNKIILLGLFVAFLLGFIVLYLNMPAISASSSFKKFFKFMLF